MTRAASSLPPPSFADGLPQIVWSAGADGRWDYLNARWTETTGAGIDAGRGAGWQASVHADDRERVAIAWAESVRTGHPFEAEARLASARGPLERSSQVAAPGSSHPAPVGQSPPSGWNPATPLV